MAPVSVCHQVSTIGAVFAPMCLRYQSQASGLIGSPTDPEQAQRAEVELRGDVVAPLHEGAHGRRRGVEHRHLVVLHDLPPAALVRGVGRALVHHLGGAVGQWPVDDVRVPGDPADVGGAPVHVGVGVHVVHHRVGVGALGQVATGRVEDALRLTGGAGGVEDEQRVLRLERLGLMGRCRLLEHLVPPEVALVPGGVLAGASHDENVGDRALLALEGGVDGGFERRRLAAPVATVGGDHDLGAAVVDAGAQGVGREAAEHHGVRRADAGAGQHGDGRLGDHRQVDRHGVALAHPEVGQGVGGALHLLVQVGVGDVSSVALGLADEVDGDPVTAPCLDVAVDGVDTGVELTVGEPLRERRVAPVERLGEGCAPREVRPGLVGPEPLLIGLGRLVQVGRAVRPVGELGGG